jgi:NagD protein
LILKDIIGGIEADIETALLFSGVTAKSDLHKYPFRPSYVFEGIGDIVAK